VSITAPASIETLPPELDAVLGTYEPERPFITTVPGGTLIGNDPPLLFDEGGQLVLESAKRNYKLLAFLLLQTARDVPISDLWSAVRGRSCRRSEQSLGTVFPLVSNPTTNYYHWLLGEVPKMRYLEWYRQHVDEAVEPLVSRRATWEHEALSLAGLDVAGATKWQGGCVSAENVVIGRQRQPAYSFMPSRREYEWLRNRFRRNADARSDWPKRIYISRDDADERRVRNEDALFESLQQHGFHRYELSALSIAEQVMLFADSEIVVGPHGAGLTNIVFADDTAVVEIHDRENVRPHYFILARTLGFDYLPVLADSRGGDLVVDVDTVVRAVHGMTE
jgi:hypothetical protein